MITDFIQHTINLLHAQSPDVHEISGIVIGDNTALLTQLSHANLAGDWYFSDLTAFNATEFSQRYDLAVLVFTQTDTAHTTGTANLSPPCDKLIYTLAVQRCRDMFAEHTLIFAPSYQDYIAFGFSKIDEQIPLNASKSLICWQFNLFDYKQLPDWFNSRFWANPENWNKFRW